MDDRIDKIEFSQLKKMKQIFKLIWFIIFQNIL